MSMQLDGSPPGLRLGSVPAGLVAKARSEAAVVEQECLQHHLGENIVFHLNLPFPLGFPTAPVFELGSKEVASIEETARQALRTFGLENVRPYAGLRWVHAIIRIYRGRGHIGWHKDLRTFEECIVGVVLENSLPGGAGLRFRPDHAHEGDELGLRERAGDCFLLEGDARHGWEHGFYMPADAEPHHRRVTLTLRWYREDVPQIKSKVSRWRRDGMRGSLYVQFVPSVALDAAEGAALELPAVVLPESFSYEKLRRVAAGKVGTPPEAIAGLSWRDTGRDVDGEESWAAVRAAYRQTQRKRPVLQLVVTVSSATEASGEAAGLAWQTNYAARWRGAWRQGATSCK